MRTVLGLMISLFCTGAFAQDNCAKYTKERYVTAIKAVAKELQFTYEEMCNFPKILDVEAQPTRVFTREGLVIPHVRVQLHMAYESCLYMVRDADQVITKTSCYSGW